jgi:3-dehydroquinate synthase
MAILNVELGSRSYPIYIDSGLINSTDLLSNYIHSKRVCIVTNDIVAPLYLEAFKNKLDDFIVDEIILPDGEAEKSLANFNVIMSHLLTHEHGRDTTLVALGGGLLA